MNLRKINGVMLAAGFAAAASFNATAVIDMDGTDQVVNIASETLAGTDADANGRHTILNDNNLLDITNEAGFGTGDGGTSYYRYDLTGAVFGAVPTLASEDDNGGGQGAASSGSVVIGGADQSDYVVFEIQPDASDNILADDHATVAAASYDIDATVTSTITFAVYGTEIDSVNETNALYTVTQDFMAAKSGYTIADTVTAGNPVATVASDFKNFAGADDANDSSISATVALLGSIAPNAGIAAANANDTYGLDGVLEVPSAFYTDAQDATITGDVSSGTFHIDPAATCDTALNAGSIACTANADDTACTATAAAVLVGFHACMTVTGGAAGDVIAKQTYTLTNDTDETTVTLGAISYDTTSIEVPYVTTYEGYNQRIYINNQSASDAFYSVTFATEDGVTATAGAAASGTVSGQTVTMMKVSDIVTLAGATRAAATIEIEAAAADIEVSTQIVDIATGGTDTIVLAAE